MNAMPENAKNASQPLSKVDKITMYGEGNNTKLIKDIVNGTTQVTDGVASGLGIDLKALISGFLGGKVSQTGEKDQDDKINLKQNTTINTEIIAEDDSEDVDSEIISE